MGEANIVCPQCGKQQSLVVPSDRCVVIHQCVACAARLTPKTGDCCVVCSYSRERCPVSVRAS